jgi:hypothetical protein
MSVTVGILVFDGVDELDFVGPLDVFGAAGHGRDDTKVVTIGSGQTQFRGETACALQPSMTSRMRRRSMSSWYREDLARTGWWRTSRYWTGYAPYPRRHAGSAAYARDHSCCRPPALRKGDGSRHTAWRSTNFGLRRRATQSKVSAMSSTAIWSLPPASLLELTCRSGS